MHFRIGVNLGDVLVEQDDLYGDGVNIAARLQALADPGGILISGPVFDQVRDKLSLGFDFLGDQSVKNIAAQVPVYRVQLGGGGAPPANVSSRDAPPTRGAAATKSADPRWHRFNIIALRWGAILGALLVINLLTWNGDFWVVWPALAIIVVFLLHTSWIFRHRR
jgi:hypothetical protein